jgi:hypothetical protein
VKVQPNLNKFMAKCAEYDIKVGLSSWYRKDADNTRMKITSAEKHAEIWIKTLQTIEKDFERIDIREEGNEWEPRTNDFVLQYKAGNDWITIDKGNKIGHTYSISFEKKTDRYIRLLVNNSGVLPKFSEIQVYEIDN